MDIKDFQKHCISTWRSNDSPKEQVLHASLGLGETGEAQNIIKKLWFRHITNSEANELREKLILELGDILYYVMILANLYSFDLDELLEKNCNKRTKRDKRGYYQNV